MASSPTYWQIENGAQALSARSRNNVTASENDRLAAFESFRYHSTREFAHRQEKANQSLAQTSGNISIAHWGSIYEGLFEGRPQWQP